MQSERQKQKKRSRDKLDITTMQLSRTLKNKLRAIQEQHGFDKLDEALDEVLSFYEDNNE